MIVSEQIIQVIDALCEKFGIVIDWTSENVIPYLEVLCGKLIAYEIGTSIAWMVIWLVASLSSIIATKKLIPAFKTGLEKEKAKRSYYNDVWDWEIITFFAIIGLVFINIISILVIVFQTMNIIKCVTFPEMYIFEYVQSIVNAG